VGKRHAATSPGRQSVDAPRAVLDAAARDVTLRPP
jgi:hypothetical protein